MLSLLAGLGSAAGALGGSNILGNLLSYASAESANSNARRIARENRQWMEKMANTAHQREVSDLRAAGLNPILSATGGAGAAVPSADTSAPQRSTDFDFSGGVNGASKGLSTALEFAKADASLDLAENQARESGSAADLNRAKAATERYETDIKRAEAKYAVDRHLLGSKKAYEEYRKAISDADRAWDAADLSRRTRDFEFSARGRELFYRRMVKGTYKNGWFADLIGGPLSTFTYDK